MADANGMNLATVWEAVAATVPDAPALVHGGVVATWRQFEEQAARLAAHLDRSGVGADGKVALYMHNRPEYLVATFAAFKVRAATVNVNYRYLGPELAYLLENSDSDAVVFHVEFADRLAEVRSGLPRLRTFVCVGADELHPCPEWATPLDDVLAGTEPMAPVDRSGDDLWLLYTGGTTGMPKGVMWPHRSVLGSAAPWTRPLDCSPARSSSATCTATTRTTWPGGSSSTAMSTRPRSRRCSGSGAIPSACRSRRAMTSRSAPGWSS